MAVSATPYRKNITSILAAGVNFASDSIKAALITSSYTPNADTDQYFDVSVTGEASGTGYTAGGVALGSKSVTYTAANSWGSSWTTLTAYTAGQIIKPATAQNNGHLYLCTVGGTSGVLQPTWPTTRGVTVADATVTWEELGAGITVITSANPTWANSTITARYCVYYDSTPGSNKPLLSYVDFGANVSSSNGTYTVTVDGTLGVIYFVTQ